MSRKNKTSGSRNLADKQSRKNALIGLFVLLVLVFVACVLVYLLGLGFSNAVDWLSGIASKLDAVVIVALISGVVSILGVVFTSVEGKRIEYKKNREAYLAQKRESSYSEFVEMFYKVHQNAKAPGSYTKDEMVKDILSFSQNLTLWGSKSVVEKWVKYRLNGANPEASEDNLFVLEDIMNEMRKDLGVKRVKKGTLLSFIINDVKLRK